MLRRLALILAALLPAVFIGAAPAHAHHYGPYVLNSDNTNHYALVRNHDTGLRYWDYLGSSEYSARGVVGFAVPNGSRIQFRVVQTGAMYWTPCGEDEPYYWNNSRYHSVTTNSVQIIEWVNYPNFPAGSCTGS